MMQDFIVDFLYENFFVVLVAISAIAIMAVIILVNVVMKKITTKVLELQTNSAVFYDAKEDTDGEKIRYSNRIVIRESEPYIIKMGMFSFIRLFIVRQGNEFTTDFPQRYMSKITKNNIREIIIQGLIEEKDPKVIAENIIKIKEQDLDDDTEKRDWNVIFESETIKQGVAGLLMSRKTDLMTIMVGIGIGLLIRAVFDFIMGVV